MTFLEYIEKTKNTVENTSFLNEIKMKYGEISDEYAKKVFSTKVEEYFFDSDDVLRLLTPQEILNAPENLHVNFKEINCIPLFDTGDNDFIVYLFSKNKWAYFNIVDKTIFYEQELLASLF